MKKEEIKSIKLKLFNKIFYNLGRDKLWNDIWNCVQKFSKEDDRFFIGKNCPHLAWLNVKTSVSEFSKSKLWN